MAELPVTRWRIVAVPGRVADVVLILDSIDPVMVEAIERAARDNGIDLLRLEGDE